MKKIPLFCATLLCLTETLLSLPKDPAVSAGSAKIHHKDEKTMVIKTSEKAIINYQSFNIDQGEKVEFLQPTSSSCVLNRVLGNNGSKILGKMESNGTIFLVNQNGIYFGKDAKVNVASLIASTLNISDENFLKNRFSFSLEDKTKLSEIYNEGFLSASREGAIILMAPIIKNAGMIQAHAGHVVLAAGEHVTLRFYDNKLLSFSVEGEIKEALLAHLGTIEAKEVSMRLPIAKKAIKEIVNRDGIEPGVVFVKENGKIILAAESSIHMEKLSLESAQIQIEGNINASNSYSQGGTVHILGQDISLKGATLDVSGKTGGGTLLIGGDFQGQGDLPYASTVSVDSTSTLLANATGQGDGGRIILWSHKSTSFEGVCYAQGGPQGGNGGMVESSSLGTLLIANTYVNTLAPLGSIGTWLLDPTLIRISLLGGGIPSGCSTSGDIAVATLEAQASTVTLCANTILQEVPISMSVSGAGLIFQAPPNSLGALILQGDITTIGGPIEIINLETLVLSSISLNTTGSGSLGANILVGRMNTDNALESLTLNAGVGNVVLSKLGDTDPFGAIQIIANQITLNSLFTNSSPITVSGPVYVLGDSIISTTVSGSGANITLETIDASSLGIDSLILDAGLAGSISLGNVGSLVPLHNFTLVSATTTTLQNVTTQSGSINCTTPVTLTLPLTTFTIVKGEGSSNINLLAVQGSSAYTESLTLSTTLADTISLGETGILTPLNQIILGPNRILSVDNVRSSTFTAISRIGTTTINGDIGTIGSQGVFIETGNLILNGIINTNNITLLAHGSITKNNKSQNIIVSSSGTILINASHGPLGAKNAPIALNTANQVDPIIIGAQDLAALSGFSYEKKLIVFNPANPPCIFIFNKHIISDCTQAIRLAFNLIPTSFFILSYFNGETLGVETLRQLGPYFITSYFTEDFVDKVKIPPWPEKTECQGHPRKEKPSKRDQDSTAFPLQK